MKLIKLQDKFILVSDEEIKEGSRIYFDGTPNGIVKIGEKYKAGINGSHGEFYKPYDNDPCCSYYAKLCKKIISENPNFSLLSEEDCKTIGWVDVEKLAIDLYNSEVRTHKFNANIFDEQSVIDAMVKMFNKAQSLNDKVFSLEQMKRIYEKGYSAGRNKLNSRESDKIKYDYIQSLQKTEWDVEVNELNQITKIL